MRLSTTLYVRTGRSASLEAGSSPAGVSSLQCAPPNISDTHRLGGGGGGGEDLAEMVPRQKASRPPLFTHSAEDSSSSPVSSVKVYDIHCGHHAVLGLAGPGAGCEKAGGGAGRGWATLAALTNSDENETVTKPPPPVGGEGVGRQSAAPGSDPRGRGCATGVGAGSSIIGHRQVAPLTVTAYTSRRRRRRRQIGEGLTRRGHQWQAVPRRGKGSRRSLHRQGM